MIKLMMIFSVLCIFATTGCVAAAPTASPQIVMDYRENDAIERSEISFTNGDVRLAATLLKPARKAAKATVVLIHGSGKSSRMNVWAGMIAQLFVMNDIAVVFPDKRGSGQSGGDLRAADFTDLANDALAAAAFVRTHPELGAPVNKIGLAGISQGGRIAPMIAAQHPDDIAFIVSISGGASPGYVSIRYERENTYREREVSLEWLLRFRACDAAVDQLMFKQITQSDYLPCTTLFSDGPYAEFASTIYPSDPDDWRLGFFPKVLEFNPIAYWEKTHQPVFVAFGARDELENVPVALSVDLLERAFRENGKTNYAIRVYPDVGHALWRQEGHEYLFDESFVTELSAWLHAQID